MEKLGFSKRILEMNFMKNIEKERNNKTNNNINESQWEISIPQIEKIVDKTIDGFYNKKKKSIKKKENWKKGKIKLLIIQRNEDKNN